MATKSLQAARPKRWEVIGGVDSNGILVREGQSLSSKAEALRLSTGAVVDEICMANDRLQYRLFLGTGPETGWVSIKAGKRELLVNRPFDPYKILNVSADATIAMIKSAFRKGSLKVHPDQNPSPDAAVRFRELTEARDFLLSPTKRLLYNIKHGLQQKVPVDKWWVHCDWDALFEEITFGMDDVGLLLAEAALMDAVDTRADILVLGATGLTGMLVCKHLQQYAPGHTFSMAGRDERKLDLLKKTFGKSPLFREVLTIKGDEEMESIVKRARVVIDVTGPKFEMDVSMIPMACVRAGTHLVDVGGFRGDILARAETSFRHSIDVEARKAGVALAFFAGWCAAADDFAVWNTVQFLRQTYGTPTARMLGYDHLGTWTIGGTLLKSFAGNGNLVEDEKRLGEFMLGGERSGCVPDEEMTKKRSFLSDTYGVWMFPQVFPDRVVVRASCGLMDNIQPYGDNFQYKNYSVVPDKFAADSAVMSGYSMAKSYKSLLKADNVAPPGTGPKERLRDEAVVTKIHVAEAEGDEDNPQYVYSIMRMGPGGAGDPCEASALTTIAGACCLLDAIATGKDLHHGFGTPVYHFAHLGYKERMEEAGFKCELHKGDLPKDLFKNLVGGFAALT